MDGVTGVTKPCIGFNIVLSSSKGHECSQSKALKRNATLKMNLIETKNNSY